MQHIPTFLSSAPQPLGDIFPLDFLYSNALSLFYSESKALHLSHKLGLAAVLYD